MRLLILSAVLFSSASCNQINQWMDRSRQQEKQDAAAKEKNLEVLKTYSDCIATAKSLAARNECEKLVQRPQ